jgi:CheY-like chemotaxis protein
MKKSSQSKPTIYVADDDTDDRELLMKAFQLISDRHHLTSVSSGKALIELLTGKSESELPCLIVLDYNMPALNGKEVLEYLQNSERYRRIPKIIYTTSNSPMEKSQFLSVGVSGFMTKATTFQGILNAVKIMLSHCDNPVRLTA